MILRLTAPSASGLPAATRARRSARLTLVGLTMSQPGQYLILPELGDQRQASTVIQFLVLGFWSWELITTSGWEVGQWQKSSRKWSLWLFTFGRYYGLVGQIAACVINVLPGVTTAYCSKYQALLPLIDAIGYAIVMPLMMVRTWAICNKNRFVGVLLAVSWLASLALSLYAAQFYIGTPFANVPGLGPIGGCTNAIANFWPTCECKLMQAHPMIYKYSSRPVNRLVRNLAMFIAWGTVDVMCFVLAGGQILLLWRRTGFRSSLQQALFREGLQYFITVMSINVINIAFTVTNTLPPFIRPAMAQPAAVATCE
ncbi:hypothetical protein IE81DRAFT_218934 [Ceraceosorus guamensis]|uniref:Uncharacterized protein n=1 Tax=Ceraceosorus guamensis TaxID=1522189 RepID=A0A316VW70_9BASI|nr:hypothetical protein IE81DRAFT_218934 [Ceraceosorus guamensis]PWN40551.1 hypothetical protein IE81DRAFT_218934 [Ceraceosorus guamensis]